MQFNRLGQSGLVVSRLCFGSLTFGAAQGGLGALYKVDQPLADQMVGMAIEAGVNYFNTADTYAEGRSEEMLGQALRQRRKDVIVATKVGLRSGPGLIDQGLSRHHILAAVEASLRRLGSDWIDVLVLHCADPFSPLDETLEAVERIIASGMARYAGVSNWPAWLTARAVAEQRFRGWSQFRAAEMYYSLVGRDIEHEVVPMALDAGVGLQVWSPLAAGFLTGRYTRDNPDGDGGRFGEYDMIPFDREKGYAIVDKLQGIAVGRCVSVAQVALAWILSRPFITSVIIGASSSRQLNDNLAAADLELDSTELADLDRVSAPAALYPGWYSEFFHDREIREALQGGHNGVAGR